MNVGTHGERHTLVCCTPDLGSLPKLVYTVVSPCLLLFFLSFFLFIYIVLVYFQICKIFHVHRLHLFQLASMSANHSANSCKVPVGCQWLGGKTERRIELFDTFKLFHRSNTNYTRGYEVMSLMTTWRYDNIDNIVIYTQYLTSSGGLACVLWCCDGVTSSRLVMWSLKI